MENWGGKVGLVFVDLDCVDGGLLGASDWYSFFWEIKWGWLVWMMEVLG